MTDFARKGSQRWLQIAVDRHPDLLLRALRRAGAVPRRQSVAWTSPLRSDGFREYRDQRALRKAGITELPHLQLPKYWPQRGPVWDAIGRTSDGVAVFVEAKAHIPEAASPPSQATGRSKRLIGRSLARARRWYAPGATRSWRDVFYQYGNRLAHHYFLRQVNKVPSILVFLYFTHDTEMDGPQSVREWEGASRLLHAALGLRADLREFGVFDVFVDVRKLPDPASGLR